MLQEGPTSTAMSCFESERLRAAAEWVAENYTRQMKKASANCTCGHPFSDHKNPPDFDCIHEPGCGCKGYTEKKTAKLLTRDAAVASYAQEEAVPETPKLPVFDETVGVDWSGCPLVERVAGLVSGVPTLRDSRLPADSIVSNFDAGESPEEIAEMYEVPLESVRGILEYAAQYRGQHPAN
jgi:uncharacterized protein (DUF433 family)